MAVGKLNSLKFPNPESFPGFENDLGPEASMDRPSFFSPRIGNERLEASVDQPRILLGFYFSLSSPR